MKKYPKKFNLPPSFKGDCAYCNFFVIPIIPDKVYDVKLRDISKINNIPDIREQENRKLDLMLNEFIYNEQLTDAYENSKSTKCYLMRNYSLGELVKKCEDKLNTPLPKLENVNNDKNIYYSTIIRRIFLTLKAVDILKTSEKLKNYKDENELRNAQLKRYLLIFKIFEYIFMLPNAIEASKNSLIGFTRLRKNATNLYWISKYLNEEYPDFRVDVNFILQNKNIIEDLLNGRIFNTENMQVKF